MRQNIEYFIIFWLLFTLGMWVLGSEYFNLYTLFFGGFVASLAYMFFAKKAPLNLNVFKIITFIPIFCYYSFMGALGVAKLALKSHLKLKPFFYTLPLNQANTHHALVANIYSLMPGTLSVAIESNRLKLHILDESLFDEELILSLHVKLQSLQKEPK